MYQITDAPVPIRQRATSALSGDLALVWGLGLLVLALDVVWPNASGIARALVGVPFGLWAPGFTITVALFPHRQDLDRAERLALALLLSIAATGGVVYGLSRARVPVTSAADVWSLLALTAAASAAAILRQQALPALDRYRLRVPPGGSGVRPLLLLVAALALATTLIVAPAWQAAAPAAWLTSHGAFLNSPYASTAASPAAVTLHVSNPSTQRLVYHLEESANGQAIASRVLTCPPQHTCQWPLTLPSTGLGRVTWRVTLTATGLPSYSRHLVLHYTTSVAP